MTATNTDYHWLDCLFISFLSLLTIGFGFTVINFWKEVRVTKKVDPFDTFDPLVCVQCQCCFKLGPCHLKFDICPFNFVLILFLVFVNNFSLVNPHWPGIIKTSQLCLSFFRASVERNQKLCLLLTLALVVVI